MGFGRKQYGQSQQAMCKFCGKIATTKNIQEFPTCATHQKEEEEAKKCVCGSYMDVKSSKWGAFYLCPNCGPQSEKKAAEMGSGEFKLNKSVREKALKPKKAKKYDYEDDRVYTLDELEGMWD